MNTGAIPYAASKIINDRLSIPGKFIHVKSTPGIALAVLVFILSGCEYMPHQTYALGNSHNYVIAGETRDAQLCHYLGEIAAKFALPEGKPVRDTTICYFEDVDNGFYLLIGARRNEDNIIVDVMTWNRYKEYKALSAYTKEVLSEAYPDLVFEE